MRDVLSRCIRVLALGGVLVFSPFGSAQMMMERSRTDPRLYTQPAPAQTSPAAVAQVERPRIDPNLYAQPKAAERSPAVVERRRFNPMMVKELPVEACDLITRDELEAILKRSDTDRALVTMPRGANWQVDRKQVSCGYGVIYERRIFPDRGRDNNVGFVIYFDDPYAKQGKLIPERPVVEGYPMALEIVNGVGDEAVFLRDVSRARTEQKNQSTAGASKFPYYDNRDYLLVRHKTILLRFEIESTVGGNNGSTNHIQIARRVLARLNQAGA